MHVIWDWNGTLLDDTETMIWINQEVFARLHGLNLTREQIQTAYTRPILKFYANILGRDPTETELWQGGALFYEFHTVKVSTKLMAPDAVDALNVVRELGWTQSLLSMYPHDLLELQIKRLQLDEYFVRIDGLRERDGIKENFLREHMAVLGLDVASTAMIGDAPDDMVAAEAVGVKGILLQNGLHSAESLAEFDVPVVSTLMAAVELLLTQG